MRPADPSDSSDPGVTDGERDPTLRRLRGRDVLIVASAGGHIVEAMRMAEVLGFSDRSRYVTFDTPQTRGLLEGHHVSFVPYVPPRGLRPALMAARQIARLPLRDYACVFSTGSAIAVSGWLAAQLHRVPTVYVESLARTHAPSLTGRMLTALPRVRLYTQHPAWSRRRWRRCPSVLGAFTSVPVAPAAPAGSRKIFVTLGTIRPYRFDRLVDRVLDITLPGDEITWQLGATTRRDLPGRVVEQLSAGEFDACVCSSDVVIAQSGVGTLLRTLELGISPITVPRQSGHREHVDDHQLDIAQALDRDGLALLRTVEALSATDLRVPRPRIVRASGHAGVIPLARGPEPRIADTRSVDLRADPTHISP